MAEVKWIKLTVAMFDDEKIKLIQSMPEGSSMLVIWIRLILLAGKCNCGGYVYFSDAIPYTEEMLSTIFNYPLNSIKMALHTFEQFKMIEMDQKGIYLINFEKYQNIIGLEEIREYNKLAKRKERERKKNLLTVNDNVNDKSTKSHGSQDTDLDLDLDKEKDLLPKKTTKKNFVDVFNNNIFPITPIVMEMLSEYEETMADEVIQEAIKEAVKRGVRKPKYIEAILKDWKARGVKDIAGVKTLNREKEQSKPEQPKQQQFSNGDDLYNAIKQARSQHVRQ